MPLLDDFLLRYFSEGEKTELLNLFDQIDVIEKKCKDLSDDNYLSKKIKELTSSDLEIGETQQERTDRIEALKLQYKELAEKHRDYRREIRTIDYKIDSIRKEAYFRYSKDKELSEILQDCLEIIDSIDLSQDDDQEISEIKSYILECDIQYNQILDLENIDFGTPIPQPETPIIQCSYTIYQQVNWYLDYFKSVDSVSYFKILKAIYDKTLVYFPDGLTDQDKQNQYCVFDQEFFKALATWNEKTQKADELQKYEFEILSNYQPDKKGHILPSVSKVRHTMFALSYLGTEPHQMTINDYLEAKTVNDLVTFKGLDDDGLSFVFNENAADKNKILVSFKNLDNARGGGTAPSVVFAMILEKMNKLGFFNRNNVSETVTISIKELIENGDYANWRSAQRALEQALKTCSELMINFKRKKTGMDANLLWFSSIGWKDKSTIILSPNKDVYWPVIGQHFAIYPIYLYKLKTHAYKLAYYIFTQARINKPTNEKGEIVFKCKLTTIGQVLGLPPVENIKNFKYKQNFLDKVIKAMKEIEDAEKEHYQDDRLLELKLDHKKNLSPKEIIETANLVVTIKKSDITEIYQMIRDRQSNKIEKRRRNAEKQKRESKEKSDQT